MKTISKRLTAILLTLILCLGSILTMTAADDIELFDISLANFTWSLPTLDGGTINQDSFPGKTQLFVFYSPIVGGIVSDLANREWADRDDIQVIVIDAKGNSAEDVAKFKEQYAPGCDNMIFAYDGSNLMWQFVLKHMSGSIYYSYCAVVQDKVLKYGWDHCSSATECREVLAKVLGEEEGAVITTGLKVAPHTAKEIKEFAATHPASLSDPITYKIAPSLNGPYSPGVLSDETAQSALNMLNQVRYIAGLSADVTWNDSYAYYASSGTLLNYLNNTLSHYPVRPSVLSGSEYDDLYNIGYTGSSSSNIASGYATINSAIINGWMADDDYSNIDTVGHRRWFLNLSMDTIGFGVTGRYSAAHVTQSSWAGSENYVAWPAQNMPVQYFSYDYPWSISLGNTGVTTGNVTVKMVRRSDGASWSFDKNASDGDFYVSTARTGSPACIIFRPSSLKSIAAGDAFDVTVTFPDSVDTICLEYTVTFFDLNAPEEPEIVVGDIDGDGSVNINDVREFKLYFAGSSKLDVVDISVADINGDGKINAVDYIELKKLAAA